MPKFGQNIAAKKSRAISIINEMCGNGRAAYITDIPGQQAVYAAKEAAARNLTDNGFTSVILEAEVGITGSTQAEVAEKILEKADEWRLVISRVENCRLFHVSCVRKAATVASVDDAVSDFAEKWARLAEELP